MPSLHFDRDMDRHLLDRVKSRKLVQWALAYAAATWLVLQIIDVVAEPWAVPTWVVRGVQIMLGTGFLLTLILAWYHGEKGRQRVSGPELVLIAALLFAGGLLTSLVGRERTDGDPVADAATAPVHETLAEDLRRRIAVLPLDNLTGNADREHVVQGLYEAIAFGLGSIRSLEVISTTSAETYRGTSKRAPEIGRELSVGSLLSGSVTAQDDSVRITLNLIDAERDTREWTGRFEGDLSDLMRLEDDIARDVARQLRAHLTPREDSLLATSQQIDPRAGDLYLRARTAPSRAEAIPLLEEAIRIDPDFAAPYGELARRFGEEAFGGGMGSATPDELYDRVVQLASRGLQIDSTLASALTALAEVKFHRDWDYDAGLMLFQRALDINPSYGTAHMRISAHQAAMGRADEAIASARVAQAVDPRTLWPRVGLADSFYQLNRFEEAVQEADVALRMAPGDRDALIAHGLALIRLGRHEEGLADLEQAGDSTELAIGLALAGRTTEAVAIRDALADPARAERIPPYGLARIFALTGDANRTVSLLEQAAEERAGALMWLNVDPDFEQLRSDPRVRALLDMMRFPGRVQ